MLRAVLLFCLCLAAAPAQAGAPAESLFSADGYRADRYRSPTPQSLEGARTLDTAALQQLLTEQPDAILIDTLRNPRLHERFVGEEHRNIPGSLWLANVGSGTLEPEWQQYFEHHLARASAGDLHRTLVFYCKSDCWLSWNAGRRALALGYARVYWYRDGVDAWQEAGLPLEVATPAPMP